MQELGEGARRSGSGRSGLGATISRVAVGTLSLWLRAHEAATNGVDSLISRMDIGARLAVPSCSCHQ